jgi:uncharacterized protein (DUF952 family)
MRILHLASASDWRAALGSGTYRTSTRGRTLEDVGFIHASTPDQLRAVAEVVYTDCDEELVVLVTDDEALRTAGVPVRYEDGGDGVLYPHIYGPLRPTDVTEVVPAAFDPDGRFTF